MAPNMRVGFKERQHKRLPDTRPPTKNSHLEVPCEEPVPDVPMVQVPHFDTVRPCQELVVRPSIEDTFQVGDEAPIATLGGNAREKDVPATPSS